MCAKNIRPAINIPCDKPEELSAEEFQKRLYGWFQDRGLLTELRAHLRKQMIGVLKDSSIGHTVTTQQKQCLSPKVQAVNLLIGEFLLYHNYHYSLSVFSTEVPAISVLPEFPLSINSSEHKLKTKEWRFSEKDLRDLLETLGIARESEMGEKVYQDYYKSDAEPLLTNIIKCIKLTNKVNPTCENLFTCSSYEEWIKSIGELLQINNVSMSNIKDILNTIMDLVETERKRIIKEAREELLKNQAKLEEEFVKKQEEQTKKWSLISNSLEIEKTKLMNERTKKQIEAEQFSVKMLKHQNLLQDRYHSLIMREREVHKREYQLKQSEECLVTQQQRLQTGFDSLYQEQRAVAELQKQLLQELNEQRAKFFDNVQKTANVDKINTETKEKIEVVQSENKEQNVQNDLIVQLQIENKALKNVNSEQRVRIDELTERSSLLLRDLESTQAAVNILSVSNNAFSGILTAPTLLAPTSYSFDRNSSRRSVRSGSGEDGPKVVTPSTSKEIKNVSSSRDIKRRLQPKRISGFSSSTSDEGTTSQILQEARDKLRRLEEESEEVDRQYQRFKVKRDQDGFSGYTFENVSCSKEHLDNCDCFHCKTLKSQQKLTASSSHLMEYVPSTKDLAQIDRASFSDRNLNEAGPSHESLDQDREMENAVCKDSEVTSNSSGLDFNTSGVSFSHVDTSDDKSVT